MRKSIQRMRWMLTRGWSISPQVYINLSYVLAFVVWGSSLVWSWYTHLVIYHAASLFVSLLLILWAWSIENWERTQNAALLSFAMVVVSTTIILPGNSINSVVIAIIEALSICTVILAFYGHYRASRSSFDRRYRFLAKTSKGAVLVYDKEYRYVVAEGAALRDAGWNARDLIGKTVHEVLSDTPRFGDIVHAMDQTFAGQSVTLTLVVGSRHYISMFFPIYNEQWAVEGGMSVTQDITDLVVARDEARKAHEQLDEAYSQTLESLVHALEMRDQETKGHSSRVTSTALLLAEKLGFSREELQDIYYGALLHDIGKIGVPDAILHKNAPLTDAEWSVMKEHPLLSYRLLAPISYLQGALDIPYYHHERWDGSGYPWGLKKEDIPLAARLFAVVDVWDALRSDRVYRAGMTDEEVFTHLDQYAGELYDPKIVKVFTQMWRDGLLDQWPAHRNVA